MLGLKGVYRHAQLSYCIFVFTGMEACVFNPRAQRMPEEFSQKDSDEMQELEGREESFEMLFLRHGMAIVCMNLQ